MYYLERDGLVSDSIIFTWCTYQQEYLYLNEFRADHCPSPQVVASSAFQPFLGQWCLASTDKFDLKLANNMDCNFWAVRDV